MDENRYLSTTKKQTIIAFTDALKAISNNKTTPDTYYNFHTSLSALTSKHMVFNSELAQILKKSEVDLIALSNNLRSSLKEAKEQNELRKVFPTIPFLAGFIHSHDNRTFSETRLLYTNCFSFAPSQINRPQIAFNCYRLSADLGYAPAQFNLASLYSQERTGVEENQHEAFKYCQKAADQGHPRAQLSLAMAYGHGTSIPVHSITESQLRQAQASGVEVPHRMIFDLNKAFEYYKSALKQNHHHTIDDDCRTFEISFGRTSTFRDDLIVPALADVDFNDPQLTPIFNSICNLQKKNQTKVPFAKEYKNIGHKIIIEAKKEQDARRKQAFKIVTTVTSFNFLPPEIALKIIQLAVGNNYLDSGLRVNWGNDGSKLLTGVRDNLEKAPGPKPEKKSLLERVINKKDSSEDKSAHKR